MFDLPPVEFRLGDWRLAAGCGVVGAAVMLLVLWALHRKGGNR